MADRHTIQTLPDTVLEVDRLRRIVTRLEMSCLKRALIFGYCWGLLPENMVTAAFRVFPGMQGA